MSLTPESKLHPKPASRPAQINRTGEECRKLSDGCPQTVRWVTPFVPRRQGENADAIQTITVPCQEHGREESRHAIETFTHLDRCVRGCSVADVPDRSAGTDRKEPSVSR